MKPTEPRHAGLLELLDRLLDKGVILQADLLICLAGVPLIGIWLRAAVAAVETMLRYGIWEDWDAAVRASNRGGRGASGEVVDGSRPDGGGPQTAAGVVPDGCGPRAAAGAEGVPPRFTGCVWRSGMGAWARGDILLQDARLEAGPGPAVPYQAVAGLRLVEVPAMQGADEASGDGEGREAGRGAGPGGRRCLFLELKDGSGLALVVDDLEGLRRLIQDRVEANAPKAAYFGRRPTKP
ncbi:MAG: gas vesicle protein [Acetobacteraceae bacterium]|nr:gas vesicle protein [Acetobacteraceae bacterium]